MNFTHAYKSARFQEHYGRWIKLSEDEPIDQALAEVRKTPLLLCSIALIAVRHTTQDQADSLAPKLFLEAKRLVSAALITVPQSMGSIQAAIILSLWSTTVDRVPMGIDSWILTGYSLQQARVSVDFAEIQDHQQRPSDARAVFKAWCIWNHLVLSHLQYVRAVLVSQTRLLTTCPAHV